MPRVAITIAGKNPQPYRFKLERGIINIGRADDNEIVIDCPSVSSHHCVMERVDGGYVLRDHQSTNGIKLRGELMEVIDLKDGLDVFIGDVEFEYTLGVEENEIIDRENFTSQERKKLPRNRTEETVRPARSANVPMASAKKSGGFLTTVAALLLAVIAFAAGVNASYSSSEKRKGRENVSLFKDIKDGRTPAPDVAE